MLVVSKRILSLTAKTRCRKLEPGICAWLQRVIIKGIRNSDILRKPFNSSEFILKIVKYGLFIALTLLTGDNSGKKKQIWARHMK